MRYSFSATGHKNILATHKTTLEFTKDSHLTEKGDCIVAVNSNFNLNKIKKFLNNKKINITIETNKIKDTITATPNPSFNDKKEIVIRKTDFISKRTLAINADKSASELKKDLIEQFKNKNAKIKITIEQKQISL